MTKLEIINLQHQSIHDVILKIEDVIMNRENSSFNTHKLIEDLLNSFKYHFYEEELLMSPSDFNKKHMIEHYKLVNFLQNILKKEHIEVESILFLKKWEIEHFEHFDKAFFNEVDF